MSTVIEVSRLEERILGYTLLQKLTDEQRQRIRRKIRERSVSALQRIDRALQKKTKVA